MVIHRGLALCAALGIALSSGVRAETLRFAPASVSGMPGDLVEVQVLVSSTVDIGGLKFTLNYDETVATFEDIDTNGLVTEDFSMLINIDLPFGPTCAGTNKNALVQLFGGGTNQFVGSDQLVARLFFRLSSQPCGATPLCWDPDGTHTQLVTAEGFQEITSPQLQLIDANLANDCVFIHGNAHYYSAVSTPALAAELLLSGVQVTATQDSQSFQEITDSAGDYDMLGPVSPSGALPSDPGPVSMSATRATVSTRDYPALTGHDLNLLLQHSASLANPPLTPDQVRAGNVTGGVTSSTGLADALALAQFLAFIPASPSNETGKWVFNFVRFVNGIAQLDVPESLTFPVGATSPEIVDLRGFILGDVDGNGIDLVAKPRVLSDAGLYLEVLDRSDGFITVGLLADAGRQPLETLLYSFEFDRDQLSLIATERSTRTVRYFMLNNATEPGRLHGVLASGAVAPIAEAGPLLSFRFRQLASGTPSHVSFRRLIVNDRPVTERPELTLSPYPVVDAPPLRLALEVSPNPFNPTTRIMYDVPAGGLNNLALRVYDIQGRFVASLAEGVREPGTYTAWWNGRDHQGLPAGSGVYFVQIQMDDKSVVQKVSLLR